MVQLRVYVVMGKLSISLWCSCHGSPEAHCVWSGRSWEHAAMPEDVLDMMREALVYVRDQYVHGDLEELTSDCLR